MAEEKQKALIELLRGHKVYLQTHNFPDPDAISSAFGLKRYLEYYGITSTVCYVGSIDRFNTRKMMDTFGIEIYSYDDIPDMQAEDYIVHVDCQKPNANTTDLLGNEVACVDHHPVFVKTEDYKFEDIRIVGACASIVASYFQTSGVPMDEDVATALAVLCLLCNTFTLPAIILKIRHHCAYLILFETSNLSSSSFGVRAFPSFLNSPPTSSYRK